MDKIEQETDPNPHEEGCRKCDWFQDGKGCPISDKSIFPKTQEDFIRTKDLIRWDFIDFHYFKHRSIVALKNSFEMCTQAET